MGDDLRFEGVYLTGKPCGSLWDVCCKDEKIESIREHRGKPPGGQGLLVTPSLCHPHIHLDKCFLLSHPKYSDLEIRSGDFAEAMEITSKAKSRFEFEDLVERGRALVEESISFGVSHMRAFVEVDDIVGMKCVDAGLALKVEFQHRCHIQICAFAQDPIFSQEDNGVKMLSLLEEAAVRNGVDVLGSTPYVETSIERQNSNIKYMTELAMKHSVHLDFHLDYHLDDAKEPSLYNVIAEVRAVNWNRERAITLGHCTRLTKLTAIEWRALSDNIRDLPMFFVGLPTSDLFMMGRPGDGDGGGERFRGTLQVPQMIKNYGLQAALGVNNVGNAFTPQGSCDPLSVATLGVGLYQTGTKEDAEILMQCVSTRAKLATGLGSRIDLVIQEGDAADFVVFGAVGDSPSGGFRSRKSISDLVYDASRDRKTVVGGRVVSR